LNLYNETQSYNDVITENYKYLTLFEH